MLYIYTKCCPMEKTMPLNFVFVVVVCPERSYSSTQDITWRQNDFNTPLFFLALYLYLLFHTLSSALFLSCNSFDYTQAQPHPSNQPASRVDHRQSIPRHDNLCYSNTIHSIQPHTHSPLFYFFCFVSVIIYNSPTTTCWFVRHYTEFQTPRI